MVCNWQAHFYYIIPMLHKTYYHTKKNIEEKTREYAIYGGSNKPTTEKHMNAQTF